MKKLTVLITVFALAALLMHSCHTNDKSTNQGVVVKTSQSGQEYDSTKGIGFYTPENLILSEQIDEPMALKGKALHEKLCASCHTLTTETLVGPGWKGMTQRRSAAWIMNYINNPEAMIDKDQHLREVYEKCYIRMPDPHLNDEEARSLLEFFRFNDLAKK